VDDDAGRIAEALQRLSARTQVVVATGGLGPTSDDLTAAAVATALGVPLERDPASLEAIRQRYLVRGREMPETNAKQADFPSGAVVVPNPIGTAPGFQVTLQGAKCVFLPGVPQEMQTLFQRTVAPSIAKMAPRTSHQVHLRSFGLTESEVAKRLEGLEEANPGVVLGYRASFPEIEIKVHARGVDEAEAETRARTVASEVRVRVGDAIYGERDDNFPGVVGKSLRDRGLTLAIAESCTGGLVGAMLTSVPGSSDYVLFDAVTYANAAKTRILGVTPETLRANGAVSAETAAAMAEGALRLSGADLAIAITGIAGPGGGSDEKPVGTVFLALAEKGRATTTKHLALGGDREKIRILASYMALRMLRRAAMGSGAEAS
ncbi:MAG: CinA family nicotinamide mononucleotide deamidase-related protein, partial [Polyangiaceae bacterium]|nr:CinA family nicotinamide mononucleotide deamidase-related protein [Polyangiaceae bacterium]